VAGIFAFSPVDKVSTVHTAVQGTQLNQFLNTSDLDLTSPQNAICTNNNFLVHFSIQGADGNILAIDQNDDDTVEVTSTFEASGGSTGAGINIISGTIGGIANTNVEFTGGAADVNGIFTIQGRSGDTCSFSQG